MGARRRRPSTQWLGQHSLKNHKLAASLVHGTGISSSDLVVEVGAGDGILTKELVRLAGHVLAVELDPTLAIILVKRFADDPNLLIIAGDFLDLPLPAQPFRVFGNIPFGSTTRILRHLLDPTRAGTLRADLIVERGVAIKRAEPRTATSSTSAGRRGGSSGWVHESPHVPSSRRLQWTRHCSPSSREGVRCYRSKRTLPSFGSFVRRSRRPS